MRSPVLPLVVASALFMEHLDSTVLSTALPSIAADFQADPVHLKLALTSYLVSLAIFIPASGWVADRFGARRVFVTSMLVFTLGSILCGLSTSLAGLVAARVLQGLGGAMMTPVGRLLVVRSVPKSELVGSLAWLTIPALIAPLIGPAVGGLVVTIATWHWIFWINVPVGIIGALLAVRLLPDTHEETAGRFDSVGFVLSGLALVLTVTAAALAGAEIVPTSWLVAVGLAGIVALYAYVRHAAHTVDPIIDLSLLRFQTFRASVLGGTFFRIAVGATPFLLPLLFQLGFGISPLMSGLLTVATGAGAIAMKFVAQTVLETMGFRNSLVINGAISAVLVAVPAAFSAATPGFVIVMIMLASGFLRSLQFTAINVMAYAEIEPAQMSAATSFAAVGQQMGLSLGVSFAALALDFSRGLQGHADLTATDFDFAFVVVAAIGLVSVPYFMRLPKSAGAEFVSVRA